MNIIKSCQYCFCAIVLSTLFACSNGVQEVTDTQNSSFLVSQLQASSELVPNAAVPTIKEANFFHYKACLKDAAIQAPLVGEKFEVNNESNTFQLTSDIEGCIAWSSAVSFNWLNDERWIQSQVKITAKGNQLGQVIIPTYINPWKEGSKSIVDARYHQPVGAIESMEQFKLSSAKSIENSPLNIENINWRVVRKRQRDSQTILEWKLEGSPILERKDISGQRQKTSIESGRANIQLTLITSNINGTHQQLHQPINQNINWQSSVLKLEGEVAIQSDLLPQLGDLTKLKIELSLPSNIGGTLGYIQLNGLDQSQGFEFQKEDELKIEQFDQIDRQSDSIGQLDISNIKLSIDTDDMEGYFLDENLNLSITKAFRIEMNPKVILPGADVVGTPPSPLTNGKIDLKIHLFSPKRAGLDFEQPDLDQFTHISTDHQIVDIRADGLISKLFKFPTAIGRTPLLRLKTLVVVEATPVDNISSINPMIFNAEFYPLANSNNVTLYAQEDYMRASDLLARNRFEDTRGLSSRIANSYQGLKNDLEVLSNQEGHEFSFKFLSQITDRRIDANVARMARSPQTGISQADMRILMSSRNLPRSSLSKLCAEFFTPASIQREFNWGRFEDKLVGGTKWMECIRNPQEYIKVSPSDHVESFIKEELLGDIKVTKPTFVSQSRGEIFRGVGFFAAYGDRSSQGEGERDALTIEKHVGFSLSIPFIASIGIGGDQSQSVYQAKEVASMQSSFERQYTQQSDVELEYNRITLQFLARMRRCLSVQSTQAKKTMFICEDNDRLVRASENWYFIGDTRLNRVGVITNATMPGGLEMAQILRGETSFRKIWGEFRNEDRALVLEKLDAGAQSILQTPITKQLTTTPEVIGVGYPGLIVPY